MAIVEIVGAEGSASLRFEMTGVVIADEQDVYAHETRGPAKQVAKAVVRTTEQIYDEAIAMACDAASQTARRFTEMDEKDRPDEFEVTFGLSLGMGADTKIVNVDADAQVQVRMQWNRRPGV